MVSLYTLQGLYYVSFLGIQEGERAAMPGDMTKFAYSKIYICLIQQVCLSKETSLLYVYTL